MAFAPGCVYINAELSSNFPLSQSTIVKSFKRNKAEKVHFFHPPVSGKPFDITHSVLLTLLTV